MAMRVTCALEKVRWGSASFLVAAFSCGCVVDSGGINDPLPRMEKGEARALAKDVIESVVISHGGKISPGFDNLFFYRCVGEQYELAEDGRFSMSYYTRTNVSPESQAKAMGQIRRALIRRGFRVERDVPPEASREISLQAEGPHRFSVSVESDEDEGMVRFSLQTPCLLPPGVKQEKF